MDNITRRFIKYFLSASVVGTWLTLGVWMWTQYRLGFAEAGVFGILLILIFYVARRIRIDDTVPDQSIVDIGLYVPSVKLCQRVFSASALCFVLGSCCFSTSLIWKSAGWNCSYFLSSIHQQEFAEKVYSYTNAVGNSSFVGVSRIGAKQQSGQTYSQFERENVMLDSVIANVYGAQSKQMGQRYLLHGFHLFDCSETSPAGIDYLKRAFKIFRMHNDWESSSEVLHFLAYPLGASHRYTELRETIESARIVYSRAGYTESTRRDLSLIVSYAEEFGVDCTSERILLHFITVRPSACKCSLDFDLANRYLLVVCFMLMTIVSSMRFLLLCRAQRHWLSASRNSNTVPEYLEQIEKLMVLELAHGNITKADEYSRKSLELATAWKA